MMYILSFYLVFAFIFFMILKSRAPLEKKGLYDFFLILSFIIPIIGFIAALILLSLQLKKKNQQWIEEYSGYITFKMPNYEDMRAEAKQDLELISFTSGLELDRPELQKKLIVQLSTANVSNEGKLLRKAVKQKDAETIHYAATTINALNERYTKKINDLKQQFTQSQIHEAAEKLTLLYARYIESGLLSSHQEKEMINQFMFHLKKSVQLFPNEPIYSYHLGLLYHRENQYEKAEEQFLHLAANCPEVYYGYAGLLEIYYRQNMWKKLYNIIDQVIHQQLLDKFPEKYQHFIKQLGGIHVENKA
ncbi:hypothetical protein [Niallia sp. 03190]|uniref:hypothetical protein n=1 Tax=Niallia sp. 03190 TaxID=3458061 RepID=UPI004044002C